MIQVSYPEGHLMISDMATKIAMEQTDKAAFTRWAKIANSEEFLAQTASFYLFCKERKYNVLNIQSNVI